MNTKELLRQVRSLDTELQIKVEHGERTIALLDRLNNWSVGDVVKIAELALEISDGAECRNALADKAMARIDALKMPRHRQVLMLRYLLNKSWDEVAAYMGYSVRTIHRLHNAALAEFEKVLNSTSHTN